MPNLSRETVINGAFTCLFLAGATTAVVSGAGIPLVAAAVLTEGGLAAIGATGTKTFLSWLDRKGRKDSVAA